MRNILGLYHLGNGNEKPEATKEKSNVTFGLSHLGTYNCIRSRFSVACKGKILGVSLSYIKCSAIAQQVTSTMVKAIGLILNIGGVGYFYKAIGKLAVSSGKTYKVTSKLQQFYHLMYASKAFVKYRIQYECCGYIKAISNVTIKCISKLTRVNAKVYKATAYIRDRYKKLYKTIGIIRATHKLTYRIQSFLTQRASSIFKATSYFDIVDVPFGSYFHIGSSHLGTYSYPYVKHSTMYSCTATFKGGRLIGTMDSRVNQFNTEKRWF